MSDYEHMSPTEQLKALDGLLRAHDWYYMHSDDHAAWMLGALRAEEIETLRKLCGRDGEILYTAHHHIRFGPHNGFSEFWINPALQ